MPDQTLTANARYGVNSMSAPLRRVAMRRPVPGMAAVDPAKWHYGKALDALALERQYGAFADLVADSGAEILWVEDSAAGDDGLADSLFTYDPSFVTPAGAVLLRLGKVLREPESRLHAAFYDRLGVPVIGAIEAPGTVDGGDCFWIDETTLAVGRGFRTNQVGIDQLQALLAPQGVTLAVFDLPVWEGEAACMHLMSLVSPLDRDLALIYARIMPVALYSLLRDRGITCLEAPDAEFMASGGLNLNVLATGPRRCIALEGFPVTARLMRDAGCDVAHFPGDELCIPCEGGPTCMTRPILRG